MKPAIIAEHHSSYGSVFVWLKMNKVKKCLDIGVSDYFCSWLYNFICLVMGYGVIWKIILITCNANREFYNELTKPFFFFSFRKYGKN